jgi:DNA-directed RNA polymerase subunit H (RpoH/RPB5)
MSAAGAGEGAAHGPSTSRTPQEDVGYETAKLKGVDVICQLAVMLRQRGLRIVRVVDVAIPPEEPNAAPMATPPDATATLRAEQWMLSVLAAVPPAGISDALACAPSAAGSPGASATPVIVAQVHADEAPHGTVARLHLDRGLARDRDTTAVFIMPAGRVNVKQLRVVREAIEAAHEIPARVIVAARERIQPAALEVLRVQRQEGSHGDARASIPERFLLSELTYNLTRHYLVPKHRLCSPEEVAALKRRFPRLALQARDDAISRFYGLLPGDVVVYHRRRAVGLGGDYYREVS